MKLPLRKLGWPESKSGSFQPSDEFSAVQSKCTIRDRQLSCFDVDVIVVALKSDATAPQASREIVQLIEVTITDEVTPGRPTPRPACLIDENGHRHTLRRHRTINHHRQVDERLAHSKM